MSQPVIIEFRSTGLGEIAKQFEKAGQAAKKAGEDAKIAASKPAVMKPSPIPAAITFTQGPNQRLAKLQTQHNQAVILGNLNAQKDIQVQMDRVQKQIDNSGPKVPPTFGQKLSGVLSSSRIGSNGSLMPLVGQLAGLAEESGPLGAVAGASLAAAAAIFKLASESSEVARRFAELSFATGSRGATAATLGSIGSSIGLSSEAVGGLSASISERLRSDPMAMVTGARMGIGPALPRVFDSVDEGGRLLKVIEGLRSLKDFDSRVRAARNLGAEALLPATNMSDRQFARVKSDAALQAQVLSDPKFQTDAADFAASLSRVTNSVETFAATLGKPAVSSIGSVLNGIADSLNNVSKAMATPRGQGAIKGAVSGYADEDRLRGYGSGLGTGYFGKSILKALGVDVDDADDKNAAMDRNSDELNRNTEAITRMTGVFGAPGDRFDRAIPIGLNNEYLRRALESGGLRLPPF